MIHNDSDCYNTLHCLIRLTSGPSIHFIGSFGFGFRSSLLLLVYYSSMGQLITVEPWSPQSRLQLHTTYHYILFGSLGSLDHMVNYFSGSRVPCFPRWQLSWLKSEVDSANSATQAKKGEPKAAAKKLASEMFVFKRGNARGGRSSSRAVNANAKMLRNVMHLMK